MGNLKRLSIWMTFLLLVGGLSSCLSKQDTCTQGDTMTNPRLANLFDPLATTPQLQVSWDVGTGRGAELTDAYFAEVTLSQTTNPTIQAFINSVSFTSPRIITISFKDLSNYFAEQDNLSFDLSFPDRLGFISCDHPGMQDQYFLSVELLKDDTGNINVSFEQQKAFAAL